VLYTLPNNDSPLLVGERPLLGLDLWEHAYCTEHQWRQGDLVLWDNRSVMHKANPDYDMNQRRFLYRLMLKGEAPVPVPLSGGGCSARTSTTLSDRPTAASTCSVVRPASTTTVDGLCLTGPIIVSDSRGYARHRPGSQSAPPWLGSAPARCRPSSARRRPCGRATYGRRREHPSRRAARPGPRDENRSIPNGSGRLFLRRYFQVRPVGGAPVPYAGSTAGSSPGAAAGPGITSGRAAL